MDSGRVKSLLLLEISRLVRVVRFSKDSGRVIRSELLEMIKELSFGKTLVRSGKFTRLPPPMTDISFKKGNLGSEFFHKLKFQLKIRDSKLSKDPNDAGSFLSSIFLEISRLVRLVRLPKDSGRVIRSELLEMIKELSFGKTLIISGTPSRLVLPVSDIFFKKGNLGSTFSHKSGCQFNSKNSNFFRFSIGSGKLERLSLLLILRLVRLVRFPKDFGMV